MFSHGHAPAVSLAMTSFKQVSNPSRQNWALTSSGFFSALPSDHVGAPAPTTAGSVFLRLSNCVKVLEHNLHQTLTKRRFLLCLLPDWKRRFQSRNPPFTVGSSSMFPTPDMPQGLKTLGDTSTFPLSIPEPPGSWFKSEPT